MRHYISITVFLFFLTIPNVFGQTFSDCTSQGPMYVRVEQTSTFNGSLQEYFETELKGLFQDLNGDIKLQILIDTSGKACCMSINGNSSNISSAKIKDAVNKMTGWSPAKQNNHSVNFSAVLQIIFNNSKLSVNYVNEKPLILKPVVNTNTSNNPENIRDKKTKSIWKLWNFSNSMIPANLSRNVAMDSNGVIWYCTDNGLVRIVDDHWQIFNGMNVPALSGKNNYTWTTGMLSIKRITFGLNHLIML